MGPHITSKNIEYFDTGSKTRPGSQWPVHNQAPIEADKPLDHFVNRDGRLFAGTHLILDLWQASNLDDLEIMEAALRQAITASNATLLHIHLHHFTPFGGISGVAVLAESHISVHTWPEREYAAFDVFMCGDADPEKTIPILMQVFTPGETNVIRHCRGEVDAT